MTEILTRTQQDVLFGRLIENAQDLHNQSTQPHVLLRPKLILDGDSWCALYGDNLQEGVAGFGDSPNEACINFNFHWNKKINHDQLL